MSYIHPLSSLCKRLSRGAIRVICSKKVQVIICREYYSALEWYPYLTGYSVAFQDANLGGQVVKLSPCIWKVMVLFVYLNHINVLASHTYKDRKNPANGT